jgi:hypothetical protein
MPITTTLNAAERVRYTSMSGEVCEKDLIEAVKRIVEDPGADLSLDLIVDLRAVERLDVSATGAWQLAQLARSADRPGVRRRVAIVASSDYLSAMARMYATLRSGAGAPAEYRVFREIGAGREWLGLAPEKEDDRRS